MNKGVMLSEKLFLIFVCLFCIAVTFYCQTPALFSKYIFHEDLRGNIFWMERSRNSQMFYGDMFAEFSEYFVNPLLKLFYKFMSPINVVLLSKLLSFPLCLISVIFIFRLCNMIAGKYCAFFSGIIFTLAAWQQSDFNYFGVGNSGDFVAPLVILFLYYWYSENVIGMLILLILQLLFYPPIFLICLGCFAVYAFLKLGLKKALIFLIVVLLVSSLFMNNHKRKQVSEFGRVYAMDEIKDMQEFKSGGRVPLIYPTLFERIFNDRSGIGEWDEKAKMLYLLALICVPFYIIIYIKRRRVSGLVPVNIAVFFLVSLFLYVLANIFMLNFFEPSRYMLFSLPITLIIIISVTSAKFIDLLHSNAQRIFCCYFFVFVILLLSLFRVGQKYEHVKNAEFFEYLHSLPGNILIGAHPYVSDNIPLLAKKRVFIMSELACPYFKKYYETVKKRTYDFFSIYYTQYFVSFLEFCNDNNIDYFVIRKADFDSDYLSQQNFYYLPFNSFISMVTQKNKNFALVNAPADLICYEDDEYILLNIKK